jgi:hypothetical protein
LTITEFLLARITEDEAVARTATDDRFSWASVDYNSSECETHGTRHDPARILAECAAKRAIIHAHQILIYDGIRGEVAECIRECPGSPCETLQALATVYATHEDYHPEWAL